MQIYLDHVVGQLFFFFDFHLPRRLPSMPLSLFISGESPSFLERQERIACDTAGTPVMTILFTLYERYGVVPTRVMS